MAVAVAAGVAIARAIGPASWPSVLIPITAISVLLAVTVIVIVVKSSARAVSLNEGGFVVRFRRGVEYYSWDVVGPVSIGPLDSIGVRVRYPPNRRRSMFGGTPRMIRLTRRQAAALVRAMPAWGHLSAPSGLAELLSDEVRVQARR